MCVQRNRSSRNLRTPTQRPGLPPPTWSLRLSTSAERPRTPSVVADSHTGKVGTNGSKHRRGTFASVRGRVCLCPGDPTVADTRTGGGDSNSQPGPEWDGELCVCGIFVRVGPWVSLYVPLCLSTFLSLDVHVHLPVDVTDRGHLCPRTFV